MPTEQHDLSATRDAPVIDGKASSEGAATKEVRPSMLGSIHEQCSACGAAMASDQRYCLVCGERNGPARVPALDAARRTEQTPGAPPPHRQRGSANTALIAGVGTLLLALGVGVLIGRSSNSSTAKTPPAQVVTVGGSAGAGSAGTSTGASPTAKTPAGAAAKVSTSSAAGGSGGGTKVIVKKPTGPPPKAVHIGSPGKGPGYQKGHFTGNFFGPESEEK
jgi:hypothetical protein